MHAINAGPPETGVLFGMLRDFEGSRGWKLLFLEQ
jgi:hypothetical protein